MTRATQAGSNARSESKSNTEHPFTRERGAQHNKPPAQQYGAQPAEVRPTQPKGANSDGGISTASNRCDRNV